MSADTSSRSKNTIIIGGALFIASLLPVVWLLRSGPAMATLGSIGISGTAKATDIPAVTVERGILKKSLVLDGELRAVKSRTVFASTSEEAKITYLPPEATLVNPGDRVVELDSSTILNKIQEAEERLVAAENEVVRVQSTLEATIKDLEVQASRLKLALDEASVEATVPEGVLPRREHQERQLAFEKAQAEYDSHLTKIEKKKKELEAEIALKTAEKEKIEIQLRKAKENLKGMQLTAPSEGMVIYADHWAERRKLQIGDVVWGGFPLVRLPDLREMEVIAQVNEVDGPKISIGQKATISLDSYPDVEIQGAVKEISQTAIKAGWMAKAKIFRAVISMDKTISDIMKPGMSARVSLLLNENGPQLVLPRSAVRIEADSAKVLRVEGEGTRPIAVTILSADATHYSLADNGALQPGDKVAIRW